eukprot:gene44022-28092_t
MSQLPPHPLNPDADVGGAGAGGGGATVRALREEATAAAARADAARAQDQQQQQRDHQRRLAERRGRPVAGGTTSATFTSSTSFRAASAPGVASN